MAGKHCVIIAIANLDEVVAAKGGYRAIFAAAEGDPYAGAVATGGCRVIVAVPEMDVVR